MNPEDTEDMRNAAHARRIHRARMTRTTDPRDPDYIDPEYFADHDPNQPQTTEDDYL